MTAKEFVKRVTENGAKVTSISRAKKKAAEKKYQENRAKTNKMLNDAWYTAAPRPRKGMRGH